MNNTSLAIILLGALALTIIFVPAVSGIYSLQQAKATVPKALCGHNPLSERVNLFRHHMQSLQIMVICLT